MPQKGRTAAGREPQSVPCGPLIDNHGRTLTYLRLAITDRCNLRCVYCMPEEGVESQAHRDMLSYEELEHLVRLFLGLGLHKVRITGGEPFARRGCMNFLRRLVREAGVRDLYLTTNGVAVAEYLDELKELPIAGLNLSLDTLDRMRFIDITRRDRLDRVLATFHGALERSIPLKVNSVVTERTSDADIVSLAALAERYGVTVRFIEQMPFSGSVGPLVSPALALRDRLLGLFPDLRESGGGNGSTARLFGWGEGRGTIGIIEGKTRKFCASCNKLRITPQGILKTCLYDSGVLDLRLMLREGATDLEIAQAVKACVARRHEDGHRTEMTIASGCQQSMASIGG